MIFICEINAIEISWKQKSSIAWVVILRCKVLHAVVKEKAETEMRGCKDMRNNRFSIRKQVKAAPLYGVGLSLRTAEPTEVASFDEL